MNTNDQGKLRILVVENEPVAREILADLLKMAGYDVLSAISGEQALWTLVRERGRIDCLYTGIELPGLVDGWMLADEYRQTGPANPVVFASNREHAAARRAEATMFVAHPALPPKVVEAVNEITGRSDAALRSHRPAPRALLGAQPQAAVELSLDVGMAEPIRAVAR